MSDQAVDYSKDSIPVGTIVITRGGWEDKLYNINDLPYMLECEPGQLFNAVARYYGKTPKDYGAMWPKTKTPQGTPSKAFVMIQDQIRSQLSDYLRLTLVCDHLGEDVPELTEE